MPGAAACLLAADALIDLASGKRIAVSPRLTRALKEKNAGLIVAVDAAGEPWRLRPGAASAGAGAWLVQALHRSRLEILSGLRSRMTTRLAPSVLHELRNPLNALTLHCDLLGRSLKKPAADAGAQAAARLAQMKERLKDLNQRQDAVGLLWLAAPEEDSAPCPFATLLDESLRLLRNECARRELRMSPETLAVLDPVVVGSGRVAFQLALLAAGLWAIDAHAAQVDAAREIRLRGMPGPALELQAPIAAPRARDSALPVNGEPVSANERAATLSLLLEESGIAVSLLADDSGCAFRFP